jgi:hypothetical protein
MLPKMVAGTERLQLTLYTRRNYNLLLKLKFIFKIIAGFLPD